MEMVPCWRDYSWSRFRNVQSSKVKITRLIYVLETFSFAFYNEIEMFKYYYESPVLSLPLLYEKLYLSAGVANGTY